MLLLGLPIFYFLSFYVPMKDEKNQKIKHLSRNTTGQKWIQWEIAAALKIMRLSANEKNIAQTN